MRRRGESHLDSAISFIQLPATVRHWDRQEREVKENKDVQYIDRGLNIHCSTPTGVPLGDSQRKCVWTEAFVKGMTSGEVIIEARRRVRKFYAARLADRQRKLDAYPASQQSKPTHLPISEAQEWEKMKRDAQHLRAEIEALGERINSGLHLEKDEAMKRVMPLLRERWTA
ncbi:hypothetical protein PG997_013649 [Apiospora hydei]|uniref:Transposase n=1 Tax=Apiospora hydei TaxID=1337664 RepID=A0ABR1V6R3_9PEZI